MCIHTIDIQYHVLPKTQILILYIELKNCLISMLKHQYKIRTFSCLHTQYICQEFLHKFQNTSQALHSDSMTTAKGAPWKKVFFFWILGFLVKRRRWQNWLNIMYPPWQCYNYDLHVHCTYFSSMISLPVFCSSSLVANDQSTEPPLSIIRVAGEALRERSTQQVCMHMYNIQ